MTTDTNTKYNKLALLDEKLLEEAKKGRTISTINPGMAGGAAQTQEERDWIANFVLENGRLPAEVETPNFQSGGTYASDSTMAQLGYQTYGDYLNSGNRTDEGSGYGPYAGSLVPTFGTTVLTDEFGRPLRRASGAGGFRSSDLDLIKKGRYIRNPDDKSLNFQGAPQGFGQNVGMGETQGRNLYNQYKPPIETQEYKPMDEEEYLAKLKQQLPAEYYQEQVRQYLQNKANEEGFQVEDLTIQLSDIEQQIADIQAQQEKSTKDSESERVDKINSLKFQLSNTTEVAKQNELKQEISRLEYMKGKQDEGLFNQYTQALEPLEARKNELQEQLRDFMSYAEGKEGSRADQVLAYIENWLSKGMPVENVMSRVKDLFNLSPEDLKEIRPTAEMMEDLNKVNEQNYSQWFEQREFNKGENLKNAPTFPLSGGGGEVGLVEKARQEDMLRMAKKPNYLEMVKGLKVSPNSQSWLLDNYQYFVSLYQQSNMSAPFESWLMNWLANGGWSEYENLPANQRGVNTKRFAPTVRR